MNQALTAEQKALSLSCQMNINRLFRRYHRWMAIVFAFPLLTTVASGIAATIASEWLHQRPLAKFFLAIHTWKFFGLEDIFPIINGIGLIGLLITEVSMTRLFRQHRYFPPA